ncbi:hypothetical protein SNE40_010787 [Patella caerulea]|uniref:SGNH hydrolase-type esterase domain-containing protein n=1 Tax=Patella caerulea TaxID=87958 RepID=A0AAN8K1P8_PATCE
MSVLLVGSSHVQRLGEHVATKCRLHNFNIQECNVKCVGISGGQIMKSGHTRLLENSIKFHAPSHVIVHIGGNDLHSREYGSAEPAVLELMDKLILLIATMVKRYNIKQAVICQLLPRFRTRIVPVDRYNKLVTLFNRKLKESVMPFHIKYWNLKGLSNSPNVYYDGVHLNATGLHKYYRNLRGAILHCLKQSKCDISFFPADSKSILP